MPRADPAAQEGALGSPSRTKAYKSPILPHFIPSFDFSLLKNSLEQLTNLVGLAFLLQSAASVSSTLEVSVYLSYSLLFSAKC